MTTFNFQGTTSTAHFGTGPGAFDPKYYLAKNPDVARQLATLQGTEKSLGALRHFIDYGAKEFRNPSALFDIKAYLKAYPDVAGSGANPLLHFRQHGAAEGRQAFPVQERALGRAVQVTPAVGNDPAVFDLTSLKHGAAMQGQGFEPGSGHGGPAVAFQLDNATAPTVLGSPASQVTSVTATEVWAHGSALLQQAAMQGPERVARLPAQPGTADHAVVLHGAGAETLLPVASGTQDVRLLLDG